MKNEFYFLIILILFYCYNKSFNITINHQFIEFFN
jgi:hypothetical protein